MALTERKTIIPNPGKKKSLARRTAKPKAKRNTGHVIGYRVRKNAGAGRKPANMKGAKQKMAKTKKKARHGAAGYGHSTKKRHNAGKSAHHHITARRRNAGTRISGGLHGMGDYVINGLFVVAGALGTKLLTQMVLGAKNSGLIGYGVNALTGAVLWFAADRTLKNKAASSGIVSGTVVQLIIRLINDYTPFGQYLSNLGMGDYQAQAFLTPQVLVDPVNSARIRFPAALTAAPAAAPATAMAARVGVSGFDPLYGGRSDLY